MGRLLILELFDQRTPEPVDAPPSPDWQAGHLAGMEDGLAQADARQSALREDVAQAMIGIVFTYTEARTQILRSLGPLFQSVMDNLLPQIGRDVLLLHILDHVNIAAEADSGAPMRLTVHPSARSGLVDSLPTTLPLPIVIDTDPALGPGQVMLLHRDTETTLDLDGLTHGMRAILAALFDETERKTYHG